MPGQTTNVTWLRLVTLGLELAVGVGGGALLGWWIDQQFATAPWGVLGGSLVGMAAGMTNLVRRGLAASRGPEAADRKQDRDRKRD